MSLKIGSLHVDTPVVLAPMAGITNAPFRRLCRSFVGSPEGCGLLVSEMITARGLAERNEKTLHMARFADDEPVRSIQLYGTDPATMGEAVRFLVSEHGADHIDLNFGCPVAKITRKGGGAALPVRRKLFAAIVGAAVRGSETVPVTVKLRLGIDDRLKTFLDAGRIAEAEGAAAVALHARTAEQHYSGRADWSAIGELKTAVSSIPVLGNGDVWRAADARAMVDATGCDGVVVGRGCLGRPWLFRDLAAAFDNYGEGQKAPSPPPLGQVLVPVKLHAAGKTASPPPLGEVLATLRLHAELLAEWVGEPIAVRDIRKHVGWYLQDYPVGRQVRQQLTAASTMAELHDRLDRLAESHGDLEQPPGAESMPRGKTSGPRRVVLPDGWLDHPDDPAPPRSADDLTPTSGG